MRKKLLIILCIFFFTGCDVEYNLTISDNNLFDENITMSFLKSNTNYDDVLIYKENKTPISGEPDEKEYYNSSVVNNGNYYDLIYTYKHDINSIRNSYFINNCYRDFSMIDNNNEIVFTSGNNFSCFNGDDGLQANSIKVNINTKLKVLKNNADEVNGDTYTWYINHSNYLTKSIDFTLEKNQSSTSDFTLEKNQSSTSDFTSNVNDVNESSLFFAIVAGIIIIIFGFVYFFVKRKRKKNNAF